MPELVIDLTEEYFETPHHLYLFCGSYSLLGLYDNNDISNFDFHQILFAASYLMIADSFLDLIVT